jgi:hypothetical protein
LEEKGVIFARLEDLEGVESYSAIYKGEVLVQGSSAADLRKSLDGAWAKKGDDLVRELDVLESRAIKRKLTATFKEFTSSGKLIRDLSKSKIANALRGFTLHSNRVADLLDEGLMKIKILSDKKFNKILKDDGDSPHVIAATIAFTAEDGKAFFRASSNIEDFLSALVHEGSHVLDHLERLDLERLNKTGTFIENTIGNNWAQEKRAYSRERSFQKAANMDVEYESIKDMVKHIENNYIEN